MTRFPTIYGVDFSGARLAGRTLWIARAARGSPRLRLQELINVGQACGSPDRDRAMGFVVDRVLRSSGALWAVDAPFGLPVEVMDKGMSWLGLLGFVRAWERDGYELGYWCLERARALGGPLHIYRATDRAARTPFDCYHYRIIYQTFHAMRDVLWPLRRSEATAILPFQYGRLPRARRVLLETCPSSTLKRMGLPHHSYKQGQGGPLAPSKRRVRHRILEGLERYIFLPTSLRQIALRDPGGDALDAVIAAVGGSWGWDNTPHRAIARNPRFCREGFLYA